jgi:hypothetical protein
MALASALLGGRIGWRSGLSDRKSAADCSEETGGFGGEAFRKSLETPTKALSNGISGFLISPQLHSL